MENICKASCYGYCSGAIKEYTYAFVEHVKDTDDTYLEKILEDSFEYDLTNKTIKVLICDFHHKLILLANKGKEPETYGWNIDDALFTLFNSCLLKDTYTFWYCTVHDDGILIKDKNTEEVPEWCVPYMCKFDAHSELANPCEQIDWYKKGIINYNGIRVVELEPVDTFYRDEFQFEDYSYEYVVEDKNQRKHVIIEEYSPIKKWFSDKLLSIYEH